MFLLQQSTKYWTTYIISLETAVFFLPHPVYIIQLILLQQENEHLKGYFTHLIDTPLAPLTRTLWKGCYGALSRQTAMIP